MRWGVGLIGLVACGAADNPGTGTVQRAVDPTAACDIYVQSASACINSAFTDQVAAAQARGVLTGACDDSLASLYGAAADEADALYRCFARVISEGDCSSPQGWTDINLAISQECGGGGGGDVLPECQAYLDVALDCIDGAFPDAATAEQTRSQIEGACAGSGALVGDARDAAIELYECYVRVYEEGNCTTPDGFAAIATRLAQECAVLP